MAWVSPLPRSYTQEKQEFVGLSNQGATCYMNSLLQTLFMSPEFRKEVYHWVYDPDTHGSAEDCIPLQLQLLFAKLQLSDNYYVETTALTKSFQWDPFEGFQQHDVQEFCRVLFDALEQSVEGTEQSEFIKDLYQGTYTDYVKCLHCSYESSREDVFLDLSLTVRNEFDKVYNDCVEKALKHYIIPEELTGDNQYFCERCNSKQDAMKGLKFKKLPYILVVQLNRFDLDYTTMQRVKLNDRVTFPEVLNMNPYIIGTPELLEPVAAVEEFEAPQLDFETLRPDDFDPTEFAVRTFYSYSSIFDDYDKKALKPDHRARQAQAAKETARKKQVNAQLLERYRQDGEHVYELYSVMIHSGSAMGGHYYAYIKDFESGRWYNFNDSSVKLIDDQVLKKAFGGEKRTSGTWAYSYSSTAYLLMYRKVEESRNVSTILRSEVPPYVVEELDKDLEREKQEELAKQERLKLITLKVNYQGEVRSVEIKTEDTIATFLQKAIEEFELTDVSLDNLRVRAYSTYYECMQDVYEPEETLERQGIYYTRTVALETKTADEEWEPYDPNQLTLKVYLWDEEQTDAEDAFEAMTKKHVPLKIDKFAKVSELMTRCEELFEIPVAEQVILKKSYYYGFTSEIVSSIILRNQSLTHAKLMEGHALYLERKETHTPRWQGLLLKEANKLTIKFNHPDAEPNFYGQYEYAHSVLIDSHKPLADLKAKVAEKLGLALDAFIIKKAYKHGLELKELAITVKQANFVNGSLLFVERGEPLQADQLRVVLYLAQPPEESQSDAMMCSFEELLSLAVTIDLTVGELKDRAVASLQETRPELQLRTDCLRLREKFYDKLGKVLPNSSTFRTYHLVDKKNFALQVLPEPEEDLPDNSVLVSVRRWYPSTWELSEFHEVAVSKQSKIHDFGERLSQLFNIEHENLRVVKLRFLSTFARSELESELFDKTYNQPYYMCGYPWHLANDSEVFFVKDNTEESRAMTVEEKRKFGVKSSYRSYKLDSPKEKSIKITVKKKQDDTKQEESPEVEQSCGETEAPTLEASTTPCDESEPADSSA